jgi:hypothetical protein
MVATRRDETCHMRNRTTGKKLVDYQQSFVHVGIWTRIFLVCKQLYEKEKNRYVAKMLQHISFYMLDIFYRLNLRPVILSLFQHWPILRKKLPVSRHKQEVIQILAIVVQLLVQVLG